MHKSSIILILICILLVFSSCGQRENGLGDMRDFSTQSEENQAQQYMESIITAVNTEDEELLQNLFAKSVVQKDTALSQEIQALFAFYDGEITQYTGSIGQISSSRIKGVLTKYAHASYDFSTEKGSYRLAFKFCLKDSADPHNIGLLSIYTISQSESDMTFTYWGGDEWNEGIVIEAGQINDRPEDGLPES